MLVYLQLQPEVHAALHDPLCQVRQFDLFPGRRNQNGTRAAFQVIVLDHLSRKIPVGPISDDKLYLVPVRAQSPEIGPVISFGFA